MKNLKFVFFALLAIALLAVASFAQGGAAPYNESYVGAAKAIGGGIGSASRPVWPARPGTRRFARRRRCRSQSWRSQHPDDDDLLSL